MCCVRECFFSFLFYYYRLLLYRKFDLSFPTTKENLLPSNLPIRWSCETYGRTLNCGGPPLNSRKLQITDQAAAARPALHRHNTRQ